MITFREVASHLDSLLERAGATAEIVFGGTSESAKKSSTTHQEVPTTGVPRSRSLRRRLTSRAAVKDARGGQDVGMEWEAGLGCQGMRGGSCGDTVGWMSRFESFMISHHFRFNVTRECNKEEVNDDDDGALDAGRGLLRAAGDDEKRVMTRPRSG